MTHLIHVERIAGDGSHVAATRTSPQVVGAQNGAQPIQLWLGQGAGDSGWSGLIFGVHGLTGRAAETETERLTDNGWLLMTNTKRWELTAQIRRAA